MCDSLIFAENLSSLVRVYQYQADWSRTIDHAVAMKACFNGRTICKKCSMNIWHISCKLGSIDRVHRMEPVATNHQHKWATRERKRFHLHGVVWIKRNRCGFDIAEYLRIQETWAENNIWRNCRERRILSAYFISYYFVFLNVRRKLYLWYFCDRCIASVLHRKINSLDRINAERREMADANSFAHGRYEYVEETLIGSYRVCSRPLR